LKKIIAVGHRGAAGLEPENTLLSFRKAVELGVDQIELDVRLSKDGRIVVLHDETLERTTGISGPVSGYTYSEINEADAGKGERVPLLEDVFKAVKESTVTVQIELKAQIGEAVVSLIKIFNFENRVCVTSFDHSLIKKVKELDQRILTGALVSEIPADPVAVLRSAMAERLHAPWDVIDEELVKRLHDSGYGIFAWGKIDTPEAIDKMINMEVDGIGSNYPDLLMERLKLAGLR
jgi:glycerophosphoryl diester phosphodiesterase